MPCQSVSSLLGTGVYLGNLVCWGDSWCKFPLHPYLESCSCTQAPIWTQLRAISLLLDPRLESHTAVPPRVLRLQSRQEAYQLLALQISVVHCTTDCAGTDFTASEAVMWMCGFGAVMGGSKMN